MADTDPYGIIGVTRTATQDEIRDAYRKLAKKYHPDLNPGSKAAEQKFKEISGAYELVGTAEARLKFDRGETQAQQEAGAGKNRGGPFYYETQQGGAGRYSASSADPSDTEFFESLFGGMGGKAGRRPRAGADQLYRMELRFEEAALGGEKEITLPGGKKLKVKIPAGVETGSRLRFAGQGGTGSEGAPAGDAYVEIQVRPSEVFTRAGNNLETVLPISLGEAVLGGEVDVPTLEGSAKMKIPPGVSSGAKLRMRGKGVADRTGSRGDQIVILQIILPKERDPLLEEALKSWYEKNPYNPRSVS